MSSQLRRRCKSALGSGWGGAVRSRSTRASTAGGGRRARRGGARGWPPAPAARELQQPAAGGVPGPALVHEPGGHEAEAGGVADGVQRGAPPQLAGQPGPPRVRSFRPGYHGLNDEDSHYEWYQEGGRSNRTEANIGVGII